MVRERKILSPRYTQLIVPVYKAILELGGSATNDEICSKVTVDMNLPDEIVDEPHLGSTSMSELEYQLAWARTYLKNYGVITNSSRSVWSVTPEYASEKELDPKEVVTFSARRNTVNRKQKEEVPVETVPQNDDPQDDDTEFPDEAKPWKTRLLEVLLDMDPYGFERLSQRLLRECGFSQVVVTKKTGDGGIDGTGKLKINGIFSFNVAFQCKRYKGVVGAGDIRDFRGSLTTDIEKGVLLTTGTFSKAAKEEASNPGKQQIDLIDGNEFMNKLAEFGIGLKEIKTYEIDEAFFRKI